eukprot:5874761-Pleurochrysis_carterae.AAC.1
MKPTLRRPSRRCLLRRGALRRALEAISARQHEAIGADTLVDRSRRRQGAVAAVISTRAGRQARRTSAAIVEGARRTRAAMVEGTANARSIAASLICSSILSTRVMVLTISSGADMLTSLTVHTARSKMGSKSR